MKSLLAFLMALTFFGCAHSRTTQQGGASSDEVSLAADRTEYDQMRKDIPPEVRRENDELAGILQLLRKPDGEYEKPERIRERFNKIMRDKRSRMDKQFRIEREDFTRLEKDQREEMTENQKKEKSDFMSGKPSREASTRFFEKQQVKRARFYDDAREKRRSFEAQISTRRKDFEDYSREKTNLFNQEYRNYQKEYEERMKGEDLKRRTEKKGAALLRPPTTPGQTLGQTPGQPNLSGPTGMNEQEAQKEFDSIPQNGTRLGTDEN